MLQSSDEAPLVKDESPDPDTIPNGKLTGKESMKEIRNMIDTYKIFEGISKGGKKKEIISKINERISECWVPINKPGNQRNVNSNVRNEKPILKSSQIKKSRSKQIKIIKSPLDEPVKFLYPKSIRDGLESPPFTHLPQHNSNGLPPLRSFSPSSCKAFIQRSVNWVCGLFQIDVWKQMYIALTIVVLTLAFINLFSGERYCDSDNKAMKQIVDECTPCPEFAECHNGNAQCLDDRVLVDGKCINDQRAVQQMKNQMEHHIQSVLSAFRGQHECQSYWLYNELVHSSDEVADEKYMYLSEEAVKSEVVYALGVDVRSLVFQEAFESLTESIKAVRTYTWKMDLAFDEEKGYYSRRGSKTWMCHFCVVMTDYGAFLIPISLLLGVLAIRWVNCIRERKRLEDMYQRFDERKDGVLKVLRDHLNRWVPLVMVRDYVDQVAGDEMTDDEWTEVRVHINRDAYVQASVILMDGIHKDCWKMSEEKSSGLQGLPADV